MKREDRLRVSTIGNQSLIRRILVVVVVLAVYRIGCAIPAPGVGRDLIALEPSNASLNLFTLFAGGPLTQASIFALGVTPFVTASIAMQLLESIVPSIKEAKRSGKAGQERVNRITRLIGLVLAVAQSVAAAFTLNNLTNAAGFPLGLFPEMSVPLVALFVLSSVTGFLVLLWLAELVTRHGIGNGVTVLLLASVLSTVWSATDNLSLTKGLAFLAVVLAVLLVLAVLVVIGTVAERRLPTVQATRFSLDTQHLSYLPFRVLHAGVAPIIFAVSIITVAAFALSKTPLDSWGDALNDYSSWAYMATTAVLVVAFARLYERTSADPVDMANDLVRDSRFIPGVRPGWPTARLVENTSLRLAAFACLLLVPVAVMQSVGLRFFEINALPLAGTSLLIVVTASLDIVRQAKSARSLYAYEDVTR